MLRLKLIDWQVKRMSKQTLYLECYSGISGDMTVAALLDLGADPERLTETLKNLPVDGYHIEISRTKKCGIDACKFDVILEENSPHDHGDHHHTHRHPQDIYEIIEHAGLSKRVKKLSKRMFEVVAEAEAKAHGIPIEEVHFHEVGAVDSIVDIIAAAFCIDNLGIEEVIISDLWEGCGHVKCQHGVIPVPVPAVLNIVDANELRLKITEQEGEMITPTGAAIAAVLGSGKKLPAGYTIKKAGLGAGTKDFPKANILRAVLIEAEDQQEEDVWVLESNIDDSNGEALGYVSELLLEKGARDVVFLPVFMKKSRPAYQIQVMCDREQIPQIEAVLFTRTTTIGIRRYPVRRTTLVREIKKVTTSYGEVTAKVCSYEGSTKIYPEFASIKAILDQTNESYMEVYSKIVNEIKTEMK